MPTALALRHVANEDLGQLAPLLVANGYQIRYFDVGVEAFADVSPLDAALVIVLGGPVAVYDSEAYPWLRPEVAWLRARLLEDLPTLGIGLGAQLMAAALHARVYPGSCGKEIGWASLQAGQHLADSPWLQELVDQQTPVLHWHGDTFDLPPGARHLASSARYPNQAFAWGRHGLALQFHPEVDVRTVERWLISHAMRSPTPATSAWPACAQTPSATAASSTLPCGASGRDGWPACRGSLRRWHRCRAAPEPLSYCPPRGLAPLGAQQRRQRPGQRIDHRAHAQRQMARGRPGQVHVDGAEGGLGHQLDQPPGLDVFADEPARQMRQPGAGYRGVGNGFQIIEA